MKRDDIIKMAEEAGWKEIPEYSTVDHLRFFGSYNILERFAALVAAVEREKVAAWMIARGYATGHGNTIEELLQELDWQIREQEREACAELAIKISQQDLPEETPEGDELRIACERIAIGVFIAETIRARGEQ